jgi:adenylate cyclase class IV
MYEVEYKVEITKKERAELITLFKKSSFVDEGINLQNDFYVEVKNSAFGGFDFKRYRTEGKKALYTQKIWEKINGINTRKETEKEISVSELVSEIDRYPDCLKISKERKSFSGKYKEQEIHIDMDSVKFSHSPEVRYFIEAEVLTDEKEKVEKLRELVAAFLKESLGRNEIIESPGMFDMAFYKK